MEEYPFFPLFVDLSKKKIVVVGAGKIAKRRIEMLSPFTETVKVIGSSAASGLTFELLNLAERQYCLPTSKVIGSRYTEW